MNSWPNMNLSSSSSDNTVFLEDRVLGFDARMVLSLLCDMCGCLRPVVGDRSLGSRPA